MKCPFCGEEMYEGEFRSVRDGVIYWMPKGVQIKGLFVNEEKVKSNGGFALNGQENKRNYGCFKCKTIVIR